MVTGEQADPDVAGRAADAELEQSLLDAPACAADSTGEGSWMPPPGQPLRIVLGLAGVVGGATLYGYVLLNFWSSPVLGIHERIPYAAFGVLAAALVVCLSGLRIGLGIRSPHAKLGVAGLAFFACIVIGMGAGRFVSYAMRAAVNPRFSLKLRPGERFPDFALADQNGVVHRASDSGSNPATLVMVYRGDFCPFGRFELHELTERERDFERAGVAIIAVSADPAERSQRLAAFLHTDIPLLSDPKGLLLGPLGLLQHHRGAEPDTAIPAFFLTDRDGVVRWIFTSPYYREQPNPDAILEAAGAVGR